MYSISPSKLHERFLSGEPVELLDVRTPAEFRAVHVPFARNLPLDRLNVAEMKQLAVRPTNEPLYVICQAGVRGHKACEALAKAGCSGVLNVDGGTEAWLAAGLPVERGQQTISLERQVRIAAGLLVFVGSLLAWFVNLYFIAIPIFVGAGLTFAGITNTCGMAMLLARMPWNQVPSPVPASACHKE